MLLTGTGRFAVKFCIAASLWFLAGPCPAQELQSLPDFFSGTWAVNYGAGSGYVTAPELTAAGRKQVAEYRRRKAAGKLPDSGGGVNCVPNGMPEIMASPLFLVEFYFTPEKILVYQEAYGMLRWIHTDGRSIPADAVPAYMGYSVGHWEGDTLVVKTGNIYHGTRMSIPDPDGEGSIPIQHSEGLQLRERMHLIDADTLEIRTTINDPELFSKPGNTRYTYQRHRGEEWEVSEFVCAQNNRAYLDEQGRQHQILTTD